MTPLIKALFFSIVIESNSAFMKNGAGSSLGGSPSPSGSTRTTFVSSVKALKPEAPPRSPECALNSKDLTNPSFMMKLKFPPTGPANWAEGGKGGGRKTRPSQKSEAHNFLVI